MARGCWLMGYGGIKPEDEAMLGPYTVLAASNHTKRNGSYRFGEPTGLPIELGRGVWTGAHSVVTEGVRVGAGTAVAANAVVTKDLPPDSVAGGVPARVIASPARARGELDAAPN